jgi:hypothetical protein
MDVSRRLATLLKFRIWPFHGLSTRFESISSLFRRLKLLCKRSFSFCDRSMDVSRRLTALFEIPKLTVPEHLDALREHFRLLQEARAPLQEHFLLPRYIHGSIAPGAGPSEEHSFTAPDHFPRPWTGVLPRRNVTASSAAPSSASTLRPALSYFRRRRLSLSDPRRRQAAVHHPRA